MSRQLARSYQAIVTLLYLIRFSMNDDVPSATAYLDLADEVMKDAIRDLEVNTAALALLEVHQASITRIH